MAYISTIKLPDGTSYDIKAKALDSTVPAGSSVIKVKNITVSASAWTKSSSDEVYPWQAKIPVSGATVDNVPDVILDWRVVDSDIEQMLSDQADTYAGGVIIYSSTSPDKDFTIASIICL